MPTGENSHHSLELLAPAGGAGAFYAALYAGADAIYCALGHDFNARRSADNFSEEEFQAAVKEAHLLGVRVYVPINIEIKTREIPRVLELVERAWILGADAFIVQDWGVHYELKRHFPFIETHISTQSNIHDRRGLLWCRAQGACRVTVSRELSLRIMHAQLAQRRPFCQSRALRAALSFALYASRRSWSCVYYQEKRPSPLSKRLLHPRSCAGFDGFSRTCAQN